MRNLALFEKSKSLVEAQESSFAALAKIHGAVQFKREASFALQALQGNSYLQQVAAENPDSLKQAILNIAAVGLTLSPVFKYAYLVPRDKKVMLDLSYKGLVQLAIEAKSVKFVQAELVYQKDNFQIRGRGQEPIHERNPFEKDRGEVVGAYCIAKTFDGEFLVETMTADEIYDIRDRTQAYKSYLEKKTKSCPWVSDPGEMFKKTVIRRASKSWPMTDTREQSRFAQAIDVYDQTEDLDFNKTALISPPAEDKREEKFSDIKTKLKEIDRSDEAFLKYLCGVNKREIKSFDELSAVEIDQAIVMLNQMVTVAKIKKAEQAKKAEKNEVV